MPRGYTEKASLGNKSKQAKEKERKKEMMGYQNATTRAKFSESTDNKKDP